MVERDAQADDDEEIERVPEVRLQLSHDDDEDAHEDAQVDPVVDDGLEDEHEDVHPVTFRDDFSALLWPKIKSKGCSEVRRSRGIQRYPSPVLSSSFAFRRFGPFK